MPTQLENERNCIRREISYRQRVYPRLVAANKMTQIAADRETGLMAAVLARLDSLHDPERLL